MTPEGRQPPLAHLKRDGTAFELPSQPRETANTDWHLVVLPVTTPNGESLGYALAIATRHVADNPASQITNVAHRRNELIQLLSVAHFETRNTAEHFAGIFTTALVPGLLDGPVLAQDIAGIEGLPVVWKHLVGSERRAYANAELILTCDRADWHPHNPHAERDARIAYEGLYYDPIYEVTSPRTR